ncbi:hypothetical protein FS418_12635 [Shewanella sp. YLB-09]|uniref:hypothetical protein n=1 Tax=Shewanella sp. YLB-09 TaxID=2601269 RepID=UPI0018A67EE4|nr:hypothetical protein [Shewanella sp. YLB-09]QFU22646.1 hypothetical protein FS418_12635 [Shewanella sp. YLB-09]
MHKLRLLNLKPKDYKINKLCLFIALILIVSLSSPVNSQIFITEIQPIKYPKVLKNLTTSTIVNVNWKGALGGATNATLLDNDFHQGRYLITSDTNLPITVNFSQLANEAKVNLKTLRLRYKNKTYKNFPIFGLDSPGITGEYVEIGAKVVAKKNSTAGEKFPQYMLIIEEQ